MHDPRNMNSTASRLAHSKHKGLKVKQLVRSARPAIPILLSYASPRLRIIRQLISSGELLIVPIGFRCFTRRRIENMYGPIHEKTLPFDAGFFPPQSVASMLRNMEAFPEVEPMQDRYPVCIKSEKQHDANKGHGIVFKTSSYIDIDTAIKTCRRKDRNKYIDSTLGYYTLDIKNNFVLAHYNWHQLASLSDPKKSSDPLENIKNISRMLSRRLERMINDCRKANWVVFTYAETQGYDFMKIDDQYFDLKDLSVITKAASCMLPQSDIFVKPWEDINSPKKLLDVIA